MTTLADDPIDSYRSEVFSEMRGGLTKREYFASLAMQGLLANGDHHINYGSRERAVRALAAEAVHHADTLIEMLNGSPQTQTP